VLTLVTAAYLAFLNKRQAARRVRLGKKAEVVDTSLEAVKAREAGAKSAGEAANEKAFDDLTDGQNEDFIYVL
jgi:hypothetical protein